MQFQYMDRDTDDLLSDLPLGLTLYNIQEQVHYPQTNMDYLQTLREKMDLLVKTFEDEEGDVDPEIGKQFQSYQLQVANDVIDIIVNEYDISVDTEDLTVEETWELAEALYHFFVVDYLENIQRFFYRYMKKYKAGLASSFGDMDGKKIKNTKGKEMQIIAFNLADVLDLILQTDIDEREFVELGGEPDSADVQTLLDYLDSGTLFGQFADAMLAKLEDEFSSLKPNLIMILTGKINRKLKEKE